MNVSVSVGYLLFQNPPEKPYFRLADIQLNCQINVSFLVHFHVLLKGNIPMQVRHNFVLAEILFLYLETTPAALGNSSPKRHWQLQRRNVTSASALHQSQKIIIIARNHDKRRSISELPSSFGIHDNLPRARGLRSVGIGIADSTRILPWTVVVCGIRYQNMSSVFGSSAKNIAAAEPSHATGIYSDKQIKRVQKHL